MADAAFAQLQATALTARCHNPFFRQKQLKALHDALRQDSNTLKDALKADSRVSEQEAATEVALALDRVKEHYASVDPAKELEQEYRVANNKDASNQTTPWGVVYIEPHQTHTPLISAIAALSAALAAGNCVALKLEDSLRSLPSLLQSLLTQALEADTFTIVPTAPSQEALASCLQVLQETHIPQPTYQQLSSPYKKTIAIVDRTADLASAAQHLVTARFAFGGTSPYAPDLVFVNEFVKKEFLEHVLKFAIPYLASSSEAVILEGSTKSPTPGARKKSVRLAEALQSFESSKSWHTKVVTQGSQGAILELLSLTALPPKSSFPILAICAISSLEHALSLLDSCSSPSLLAGYFFSTPATAKYLAQYTTTDAAFVNHVPHGLLLGPAAPTSAHQAVDVAARYTTAQFSRVAPVYSAPTWAQPGLRVSGVEALKDAAQEIREKKRAEWIAIGYFEQGILIGLGIYGVPLLACVGTGLFFGVRAGLRRIGIV